MATNNAVNTSLSGQTGTGTFVGSTSPTLVTPLLGTPTSGVLTNCTGLLVAGGGTGVAAFTAYAVICGGTTTTGALQSVASVGTAGQVLTSNGAGALPTFQTSGAVSGSLINVQIFTANGTYTPTSGMAKCVIQCFGGGGAGGGSPVTAQVIAGGGGGSGGFAQSYVSAATIGASQSVTVGAGGTGVSNGNGNNGSDTSVGSIVIAKGGAGGTVASGSLLIVTGGAGGVVGTGDVSLPGGYGGCSISLSGRIVSGGGGSSYLAGGGIYVIATTSTSVAGTSAVANTGAGGSGSATGGGSAAARAGGDGGSGIVIIYEYK